MLDTYHQRGEKGSRFSNEGILSYENKMPLQYRIGDEEVQKKLPQAIEMYNLAKLGYEHGESSPDGRYKKVGEEVRDELGLCATAYKDKDGKIIIAICGIETIHAGSKNETWKDVKAAFMSTAGEMSASLPKLVEFAKKIQKEHGQIDGITGHSLGGYLGMQLKIVGDKEGFIAKDAKLYTYDIPGMTHTLAKELNKQYGVTEQDIQASLHTDRVLTVINDKNSYNTLGALPRVIMSATDPAKTKYDAYSVNQTLPPQGHFSPFFDNSLGVDKVAFGQASAEQLKLKVEKWYEGDNHGDSYGPAYLTPLATSLKLTFGSDLKPLPMMRGIAMAPMAIAIPAAVNIQGAIGKDTYGNYQGILHDTDPMIVDGKRPVDSAKPQITAYGNLTHVYNAMVLDKAGVDINNLKGTADENNKIAAAKEFAENPNNLRAYIEEKTKALKSELDGRSALTKGYEFVRDKLEGSAAFALANTNVTKLPATEAGRRIQSMDSALKELKTYEQDYNAYAQNNKLADARTKASESGEQLRESGAKISKDQNYQAATMVSMDPSKMQVKGTQLRP